MSKSTIIGAGEYDNVFALLEAFHRGAAEASMSLYFGCFHRDGRFLGTDAQENWHVNEFYDWTQPIFKTGEGWIFRPIEKSRKVTYFPSEANPTFCIFDELLESEQFKATSRGSGTLVFNPDKKTWLIGQYHLSFPVPNDITMVVTKKIATFETTLKEVAAAEAARRLLEEWDLEDKKPANPPTNNQGKKKSGRKK
ncbi:unnamed protein product [Aphanomyces euteiches]|nr:hypothetical protein AeRB84_011467 [Aphanomyces euteiches]